MLKKIAVGLVALVLIGSIAVVLFMRSLTPEPRPPRVVHADPATERALASGDVVGFVETNGSHAWLGIPFAQAPVGELRWRAPRPAKAWQEPISALKIGSMCTQPAGPLSGVTDAADNQVSGSEDCLYLNVWSPAFDPDSVPSGPDRLPVMVWVHGGGNSIGHGGSYNGSALAKDYGLIVVSINYRLGPFGWFSHPALRNTEATAEDSSGNYGTLDIIHSLEWVRDNISRFGGDPENVTIFGESAGGTNVLSMMVSPLAEGLFHRAVVQSGSLRINPVSYAENYRDDTPRGHRYSSRELMNLSLIQDGMATDRDTARALQDGMGPEEIADYLHSKSNADIISLYGEKRSGMLPSIEIFGDGIVQASGKAMELLSDPSTYNSVPVIMGTTRDESKLFMITDPSFVKRHFGVFARFVDQEAYEKYARYSSDSRKARTDGLLKILRRSQGPNVFGYRFDWDEEGSVFGFDLSVALGAAHGLEIPFVFNWFDSSSMFPSSIYPKDRIPARDALARSMSSYWAEFAYTGDPGRGRDGKQVHWLAWDEDSETAPKYIIFDTAEDRGIRMSNDAYTMAKLKARLIADSGIENQKTHCALYSVLFRGGPLWDSEEYASLGRQGCSDYDPAELGWR